MFVIDEKDILGYSKRSRSGLFHAFYEAELQVSEEKKLVYFYFKLLTQEHELIQFAK